MVDLSPKARGVPCCRSSFVDEWTTLRQLGLGTGVQWMPRVHECGVIVNWAAKDKDDLCLTPW